jgi:hypothetical protein
MAQEILVRKDKFYALLGKMLETKPLTYKKLVKEPKMRKDGKRKKKTK